MGLRIRTDRFGDTWAVHTGSEARRMRKEIEAEQSEALARYDAEPTPANLSRLLTADEIEDEVGRRLGADERRAAA